VVAIRASPQRMASFFDASKEAYLFEELIDDEGLDPELLGEEGDDPEQRDPNDPPLAPVLDVPTRWSSTFYLLERALKIRAGLDQMTALHRDFRTFELSDQDWKEVKEILEYLRPFAVVTRHVEGFKYPTLSCTIPLYNSLLDLIDDLLENPNTSELIKTGALKSKMKIEKYYEKTSPAHLVSAIMDPRFKLHYFVTHGWDQGGGADEGVNLIEKNVKPK